MLHSGSTAAGAGRSPGWRRFGRRLGSAASAGLLAAAAWAAAQPAEAPTTVEVHAGDTFSGIAARYTGSAKSWAQLYDARQSGLPDPNLILPGQRFELVTESGGKRYLRLVGGPAAHLAAARPAAAKAAAAAAPSAPQAPATSAPAAAALPPPTPAPAVAAAPAGELVVGVLPNISATALMAQYESLKSYLDKHNSQKVRIVLPSNFKAFFDATMRGDFDLAVSAPHFARVAQLDARLVPLAMYEPRIGAQYIAPIDSPLSDIHELRGKGVAFANPTSLVAMYGQQWLRGQGLDAGKDYEVKGARTDMGVGRMLLSGDAAAAIMSNGEFRALPQEESARLKIVEVFARIPNFIILGHPRLGSERLQKLKSQLLVFIADKDDGAAFSRATGVSAIVEADDATLRELDPYVAPTRRAMGVGN